MNAATTVTATFTITTQLLTVTPAGTGGGTVTSAPAGINCGSDCSEPYNFGTTVTLTAAANATSTFTGWSGGGCTGTGTCVVTMNAAATVTATFTTNSYLLTVSKAGAGNGTVTSSPAGVTCGGDCTESYAAATAVTLTAVADATSVFAGWSGAGCSGTGTCLVNMTAANTVTATFDVFSFKWPDSPARYCSDGAATTTCPAGAAGQDGSYTINVPTYGVIGGRVTDNMTGLVWQRTPPLGDITQLAAVTYCDDLSLEGFDDWRLPSFIELLSIVDFGSSGPAFPAAAFPGIPQNSNYWSSTERNTTAAIVINTNWATSTTALKTDGASRLVRCVRGTPITGAFTASGGSVTDGRTKLVWQSGTSPTDLSWLNALAYCEALVLDSNSDWRLPSGKELLSLMDHTQSNPTISPVFASRPATRFWSSSPNRGFPTAAYAARFDSGLSDDIGTDMTLARSVRCVRGG